MSTHTHTLSNGAAHIACASLQRGLSDFAHIFTAGGVMKRLASVKRLPSPEKDENDMTYTQRIEAWMEQPFGEVELEEDERETLKEAVRGMKEKKILPDGIYQGAVAELIGHLGLHKTTDPK